MKCIGLATKEITTIDVRTAHVCALNKVAKIEKLTVGKSMPSSSNFTLAFETYDNFGVRNPL